MAADESYLELFESDYDFLEDEIIKLQALIRGSLIRKQMKNIQCMYEDIVRDIDGKDVEVMWSKNHHISHPTIRKVRKDKLRMKHQEMPKGENQTESSHLQEPKDETDKMNPHLFDNRNKLSNTPASPRNHLACADIEAEEKNPCTFTNNQNSSAGVSLLRPTSVSTEVQTDTPSQLDKYWQSSDNITMREGNVHGEFDSIHALESSKNSIKTPQREEEQDKRSLTANCENRQTFDNTVNENVTDLSKQHDLSIGEKSSVSSDCVSASDDNVNRKYHADVKLSENESEEEEIEELLTVSREEELQQERDIRRVENYREKEVKKKQEADVSDVPDDKEKLLQLKNTMAMELLWIQQAINSRKHYLHLKQEMQ